MYRVYPAKEAAANGTLATGMALADVYFGPDLYILTKTANNTLAAATHLQTYNLRRRNMA
jgi:hypothetical protein